MPSQLIKFSLIDANPHRDFAINPMAEEQLVALAASIDATTFWGNCLVRPHGRRYQLAYGHMRLAAAKRAGITQAEFQVRELDDDEMLRVMFSENITQFGKQSFPTYKEAVVAAAGRVMVAACGSDPEQNVLAWVRRKEEATKLVAEIRAGGAPGEDVVLAYLKGGSRGDVRTALQVFRDSGALAAWHAEHNPQAVAKEAPTVSPEAVAQFQRTHHVKTFVDMVRRNNVPVAEQPALAQHIVTKLTDNRPPSAGHARPEGFDARVPKDERLTSDNIRTVGVRKLVEASRGDARRARLAAIERMTTVENAWDEVTKGLARAISGLLSLRNAAKMIGDLEPEMSASALQKMHEARLKLAEFETMMRQVNPRGGNSGGPGQPRALRPTGRRTDRVLSGAAEDPSS